MSESKKGKAKCPQCKSKIAYATSRPTIKCPKCGKVLSVSARPVDGINAESALASNSGNEAAKDKNGLSASSGKSVAQTILVTRSALGQAKLITTGGIVGLLASVALSGLKPSIGLSGFVWLLALATAALGAAVLIKFLVSMKAEQTHTIDGRSRFLNARLTSVSSTAAGFIGIMSLVFVAETFAPAEGLVRHFVFERNRAIAEKSQAETDSDLTIRAEQEKARLEELSKQKKNLIAAFGKSDFFLVNPAHRAVGLKVETKAGMQIFRILAEAADEETHEPLLEAWNSKVPVVANSPQLARKLYESYGPGDSIGGEVAGEIRDLVIAKPFLPKAATTVSLELIEGKRKRVGHLLSESDTEIVFCDLIPKRKLNFERTGSVSQDEILYETERIDRKQISNGLTSIIQTSEGIKTATDDFLDFCVYSILAELDADARASSLSLPVRAAVYVDNVNVNYLVRTKLQTDLGVLLATAESGYRDYIREQLADKPNRPQHTIWDEIGYTVNLINQELARKTNLVNPEGSAERGKLNEELQMRLLAEIKKLEKERDSLKAMTFAGTKLQQELLSLLNKAGVVLVERSEKARLAYGMVSGDNLLSGDNWVRPESDDAVRNKLVEATHLLLAEIDLPEEDGSIHLHLRLVDVTTGEIRWNDQGSRLSQKTTPIEQSDAKKSSGDVKRTATVEANWKHPKKEMVVRSGRSGGPSGHGQDAQDWKIRTQSPGQGWEDANFDDSRWSNSKGGFGWPPQRNFKVSTKWTTSDIWLRCKFQCLRGVKGGTIEIFHDDVAEIYLNGQLLARYSGYTTDYKTVTLTELQCIAFIQGENVLAVHCNQTTGEQAIDLGIEVEYLFE